MLKDGFGIMGSLLFSYLASSHMDSNIKEWRLFADIANDVGLTLDLVAPIFRGNFAIISSFATMCKVDSFRQHYVFSPCCGQHGSTCRLTIPTTVVLTAAQAAGGWHVCAPECECSQRPYVIGCNTCVTVGSFRR